MRLTGVLVTHYHPDHVGGDLGGWSIAGVAELLAHPDVRAKLHVHADEALGTKRVTGCSDSDLVQHASGDTVDVGDIEITLIHTPGHTPGSQCFLVDGKLVSGDTLFLDGCGRTDLPGGDPEALYESLTQKLADRARRHRAVSRAHVLAGVERRDGRGAPHELRVPAAYPRAMDDDVRQRRRIVTLGSGYAASDPPPSRGHEHDGAAAHDMGCASPTRGMRSYRGLETFEQCEMTRSCAEPSAVCALSGCGHASPIGGGAEGLSLAGGVHSAGKFLRAAARRMAAKPLLRRGRRARGARGDRGTR